MNCNEFLAQLKSALENEVSAKEVKEQMNYYQSYIREEMQSGKSEKEVLDMLGDPWALAKTAAMSSGRERSDAYAGKSDLGEERTDYREHANVHVFGLDTWWKKAAVLLGVLAVIALIVSIVSGIVSLVAPIALPLLLVVLIVRMIKKDR